MNDRKLIEIIRSHPVVYDVSNIDYMDANLKNDTWLRIGEEMQTTGSICKLRWNNIRDNFRKTLKKNATLNQKGKARKHYKYASELSFLKKFFTDKETKSNTGDEATNQDMYVDEVDDEFNNSIDNKELIAAQLKSSPNDQSHINTMTETPIRSSIRCKKQKPNKLDAVFLKEYFMKEMENISSPPIQSPDPVDAFLSGIAPVLKQLPPRYWHFAKADIFAAVQKYELKMLMGEEPNAGLSVISHYSDSTGSGQPSPEGSYGQL